MLSDTRSDGTTDQYVLLPSGQAIAIETAAGGSVVKRGPVPGQWVALTECGWRTSGSTSQAFLRGIGIDDHVWETTWEAGEPDWQPPVKLA